MKEIQLNGYIIIAHPQQLVNNGQWAVNISIEKRRAGSVTNRQFSAAFYQTCLLFPVPLKLPINLK
jgi:hypothetical protein